ncbi:efflux RND transporter periplasmic adaptor subunit [Actinoplanes sp. TBRC 11911]|uniref:efflux RND transporter periplasmic adaptor subunit n=1 Tax=Actinoplanes sp. TBRC 11911 TaxID=2729386 RepID=UPI00145CB8F8|nr:efflux RND transporter periplasmic adaptor subunit [Actinoplanes sp. TBRC 11911]NMO51856.1 efflux RND transporter periplasmic adaptor subunit [Actinoplanes sp. TBRC 11911]
MKKWVAGGLVVVAAGAGVAAWVVRDENGKPAAEPVATVAVGTGAVTAAVAATGTVQPAAIRALSFAVDATVKSVGVRAGSRVAKGAVLAFVDDADAVDSVAEAKESLSEAEDRLAAAKSAEAKAAAGKTAAATSAAETSIASTSAAAKAAAASAAAKAAAPLAAAKAVAGFSTATAATAHAASSASEAAPNPPLSVSGTTSTTVIGAASAAGGTGGQGGGAEASAAGDATFVAQTQVNQARYALAEARVALAGTTITAPVAGTVMAVAGKVGANVSKGATFITLADADAMRVSAAFPEADAGSLAVGQNATVTLAGRVGEKFAASVVQVDPVGVADGTLVTYGVMLVFGKQPAGLLAGQSAAVEVTTDWVAESLRVPSTAVHDAGGGKGTVRVAGSERRVGVGLRGDQYTQITSGLTAGELVVRSW